MADEKSYQLSETDAQAQGLQDVTSPVHDVDARSSGLQTPLEIDTDYDSSLAGSGFLEGSWATVSSDNGVSGIDELGSSEDEGEDNASELSPRHTASAVHSESEIDAFSDSQYGSDDARPRHDRTYEYVTDQSWTDPDKSTPSNSTLSTFPGSYSRGLAAARTPAHSRSSTLTRAHLTQHSHYQWIDAQAQPAAVSQTELGDSQVELVFPRIAAEFGAGSVDTITSATPLLPIEETPTSVSRVETKEHNFRTSASQQLPEDDYIFLAGSFDEPHARKSSSKHVASGSTTHHAFPANTVDRRRGEKREGINIVRDGIVERGKRRLYSELEAVADDAHAEPYRREQNTEQDQFQEHIVGEVAERVLDFDADGYERLSLEGSSADVSRSQLPQYGSILEARLIGPRTRCPVNQGWLDALSLARSQGLIVVDESRAFATDDGLSESLVSKERLLFDLTDAQEQVYDERKRSNSSPGNSRLATFPVATTATSSRPARSRRNGHVRKIVTIVALPFLMLIVLSRLAAIHQESEAIAVSSHPVQESVRAVHPIGDSQRSVPYAAPFSSYGVATDAGTAHACAGSSPVVPISPDEETPQHPQDMLDADITPVDRSDAAATLKSAINSASSSRNNPPTSVKNSFTLTTPVSLVGSPLRARDAPWEEGKRTPEYPRDTFGNDADDVSPGKFDKHTLERQMAFAVLPVSNASRVTRLFEQSLALTTAMDRAFRKAHGHIADFLARHGAILSRARRIRNSGRRIFNGQIGGLFEETDALKKRLREDMSGLVDMVDQHFQDLAVELDKAIRLSKEGLVATLKETADALEKHVGVEIPLPTFVGRDPCRNRTKSTVSTWAEKFWQTLHHATVTLIV